MNFLKEKRYFHIRCDFAIVRAEFTYAAQKTIEPQHNKLSDVIKHKILLVMLSFQ